ncbi:hypothetical protein Tco_0215298 [Tanacetum coccineum]
MTLYGHSVPLLRHRLVVRLTNSCTECLVILPTTISVLEHKAYWALKHANFDLKTAGDHRKLQLNELNELHDQAYENSLIYKERTKKLHDSKIKNRIFNVGDRVLLFNSRLKIFSGKLKTRWSGPFTITKVFPYGTIELSQPDGPNFKVNGHHVKHYFGGDLPPKVVQDLQTFPRTMDYGMSQLLHNSVGFREEEPDIENMTPNEYLKYESEKKIRLWRSVRPKDSPTGYKKADIDSFHRDKSRTFNYPYYYEDIEIEKYHELSHLV